MGGNTLQTIDLLAMDCSKPLFLFDKFGSSQVVEWEETSVQTGSVGVTIRNRDSATPIRLTKLELLNNLREVPIDYTAIVQNKALQPDEELEPLSLDFEYDVATDTKTRYTFFATVIAEPLFHVGFDAKGSPVQSITMLLSNASCKRKHKHHGHC